MGFEFNVSNDPHEFKIACGIKNVYLWNYVFPI